MYPTLETVMIQNPLFPEMEGEELEISLTKAEQSKILALMKNMIIDIFESTKNVESHDDK